MSLLSCGIVFVGCLPRAYIYRVEIERDLEVTMFDGVVLLADRYFPPDAIGLPIVLLRVLYGCVGFVVLMAWLFAERGYQVVIQEVCGIGVSGGIFNVFCDEREDGLRTLDWLAKQLWFSGAVGMMGLSYLGHVQWVVVADVPLFVKAFAIYVAGSEWWGVFYFGESFVLFTSLRWAAGMGQRRKLMHKILLARIRDRGWLDRAYCWFPLRDADSSVAGDHVGFFQDWLDHTKPGDLFWVENDYSLRLGDVAAKVSLLIGWYDIVFQRMLADYRDLRAVGREVWLMVGLWHHTQLSGFFAGVRDGLDWLDAYLRGVMTGWRTAFVWIYVMGARTWRALLGWLLFSTPQRWHLYAGRFLGTHMPADSVLDRYCYDLVNLTLLVGGILLRADVGLLDDCAKLEGWPDVLTYISVLLRNDVEAIGVVLADLFVRASWPNFDLFVRICDVVLSGWLVNVCDGLLRVVPERNILDASGVFWVIVDLWLTAYCFWCGNRLRVHVSSGVHLCIARNLGGGELLASATEMHVVDLEILYDPEHLSAVTLPVVTSPADLAAVLAGAAASAGPVVPGGACRRCRRPASAWCIARLVC